MWIMYNNKLIKFEEFRVEDKYVKAYYTPDDAYVDLSKYENPEQAELALNMIARAISEDRKVFRMPNQAEIETASEGSIRDYTMLYNLRTRFA